VSPTAGGGKGQLINVLRLTCTAGSIGAKVMSSVNPLSGVGSSVRSLTPGRYANSV
jgi:hypothetical protein